VSEDADEQMGIVCEPVKSLRPPIAGSKPRNCTRCKAAIWLSPSGQAWESKATGPVQLICLPCAYKLPEVGSVEAVPGRRRGTGRELGRPPGVLDHEVQRRHPHLPEGITAINIGIVIVVSGLYALAMAWFGFQVLTERPISRWVSWVIALTLCFNLYRVFVDHWGNLLLVVMNAFTLWLAHVATWWRNTGASPHSLKDMLWMRTRDPEKP
jgi:hypothetical protein